MPDYSFGRCDGHHGTVDFRRKLERRPTAMGRAGPHEPRPQQHSKPSGLRGSWHSHVRASDPRECPNAEVHIEGDLPPRRSPEDPANNSGIRRYIVIVVIPFA
jgi:hypothetical protein